MAFDANMKTMPESKKSGYLLDGKEITLSGTNGRPRVYRNPDYYDQEKKVEAASLYCVVGNLKQVSELAKVPEKELKKWQKEPWWAEIQNQIMVEQNSTLLSKINTTIDQALTMLEDRILNGDVVKLYENVAEDGTVEVKQVRQPVKARDLSQIFHALSHQRQLMRGDPTTITAALSTDARLEELRKHFKEFTQAKEIAGECTTIGEQDGSHS